MNTLPSVDQKIPETKVDRFLLLSGCSKEEAEKELKGILKEKVTISEVKQEGTVATHQVEYSYEKMYDLRGRSFETVEFLFNDFDFYSLDPNVNSNVIQELGKDKRIAQILQERIFLFKTPKGRIDFYLQNEEAFRHSRFPIPYYHRENFGISFCLSSRETFSKDGRYKNVTALRIYQLITQMLQVKDVLLAGIEGSCFYFGTKETYEKVLSKRESFKELGYGMWPPREGTENEKDFKDSSKESKDESKETKTMQII